MGLPSQKRCPGWLACHGRTPPSSASQAERSLLSGEGIVKSLVQGESIVVNSLCFPSQFGCTQDVPNYDYNPEKAKKLLAEAGYPNGFEIPFLAYRNRDYAEAMINNLNAT